MSHPDKLKFDTICVMENNDIGQGTPHVLPIHATSAFSFENIDDSIDVFSGKKEGYVYSRFGNPTIQSVQDKLRKLECLNIEQEGFCVMTSSGLSAISTLTTTLLKPGDKLLTHANLYGGTTEIFMKMLQRYGIEVHLVDLENLEKVKAKIKTIKNIKLLYCETPSNPTMSCIDLEGLCALASEYNILSAVDNTFSTSYLQQVFTKGADFVVYSTTKFLNGHGNSIAGAIIGKDLNYKKKVWESMKLLGTNCNAFDAWLVHNGLKTLALRMERHCDNALAIAEYLTQHPKVKLVNYPGLKDNKYHQIAAKQMYKFGGMLSFEITGGFNAGKSFMNNTRLCSITSTLGNTDTLLLHPASSSHLNVPQALREANGIGDGLVRISVGIENKEDLINDMAQALDTV